MIFLIWLNQSNITVIVSLLSFIGKTLLVNLIGEEEFFRSRDQIMDLLNIPSASQSIPSYTFGTSFIRYTDILNLSSILALKSIPIYSLDRYWLAAFLFTSNRLRFNQIIFAYRVSFHVMQEFLALPRADAIHLLAQYNGNAETVIQQIFA